MTSKDEQSDIPKQGISVVSGNDLEKALIQFGRQYAVGNLSRYQDVETIPDDGLLIGIIYFEEFGHDLPHVHQGISEYQYMISGRGILRELDSCRDTLVEAGDIFVVHPGVAHVMKAQAGTRFIFIKHPYSSEKKILPFSVELQEWLDDDSCFG